MVHQESKTKDLTTNLPVPPARQTGNTKYCYDFLSSGIGSHE